MKRTFLFLILNVAAALAALPAGAQVNPEAAPVAGPPKAPLRFDAYVGFAYTSLNQVDTSRYGLIGGKAMLTRDWGKYFGLMGTADYYHPAVKSAGPGNIGNPGDAAIYSVLVGPELHAQLYENLRALLFAELGVEHTSGENMIPSTSFAGGFGGGMEYNITDRIAVRALGDRVGASFSPIDNTEQLKESSHRTWNPRATVGVVFRF